MKNKKATLEFKLVIIFLILFFGFLFYLIIDTAFLDSARKDGCKEIGFKRNTDYMEIPSCEDKQGNIHFVKFDCKVMRWFGDECSAKKIKVGEVWGTS